jgi:hypothetical protein
MSRLCLSAALLGLAVAADIAYVGDLKLFTSLVCAARQLFPLGILTVFIVGSVCGVGHRQ